HTHCSVLGILNSLSHRGVHIIDGGALWDEGGPRIVIGIGYERISEGPQGLCDLIRLAARATLDKGDPEEEQNICADDARIDGCGVCKGQPVAIAEALLP